MSRPFLRLLALLLALGAASGARAAAVVVVASCSTTDVCLSGGPASGNGAVDPGEEGNLVITLRNTGNVTATRLRALIASSDPALTLLLDTLDFADLPAGQSADSVVVPYRLAVDAACGTSFEITVTLAYSGTFRNDRCQIDTPAACFPCGADPCHPANLIPWSAGPYGTELHQTAADFTVPTLDGDWTYSAGWSGCDSIVFIVHFPGSGYSDQLWASAPLQLLQQSPDNAQFFFLVASADPAVVTTEINDMRTRTDAALSRLPAADQAHWRPRLHHVTTGALALGNWVSDYLTAHGVTAFCIDPFQKIRQVGLLYLFRGVGLPPEMKNLSYELQAFNFERDRQRQLDYEAFTEIVVWDEVLMNSGQADVTFPDAAAMARFDTMLFDLSWKCTDPYSPLSCEWDYLANLALCNVDDPTQCPTEFGRWITAYGRGGRWVTDMTPYMALIREGGVRRLSFYTPYQYTMTLKILLTNRRRGVHPETATFIHGGGNFEDPNYNANHAPVAVDVPVWARRAEIAALITGHGFGNNAENCAEFCNHQHRFTLNGTTSVLKEFPEASTDSGCVDQIAIGTVPNQYGTWPFGRGGWCPGLNVTPFRGDVTAGLLPGTTNTVVYEGLFNGAPYTPGPIANPNGFGARIDMSSFLVLYVESPEDDCTDGLDDDGDGNVDCADQGCESQPECDGFDTDSDGRVNSADCDPLDGTLAASPEGLVRVDVVKDAAGTGRVIWPALDAAAGSSTRVDVLTGFVSQLLTDRDFRSSACLVRGAQGGVDDPRTIPGTAPDAYWYLLRARNRCGVAPFDPPELQVTSPCD